jgi:hypothetical protein
MCSRHWWSPTESPFSLVLGFTLLLNHQHGRLPVQPACLSRQDALRWDSGVGLRIGLSPLRFLLER